MHFSNSSLLNSYYLHNLMYALAKFQLELLKIQKNLYRKYEWRLQALASVWAGYIQCCCFFWQPKHPHSRLCFISAIKEPAQPLQDGFWASLVPYHNFELYPFPASPSPRHPPNENIPDTTSHVQPVNFFYISY